MKAKVERNRSRCGNETEAEMKTEVKGKPKVDIKIANNSFENNKSDMPTGATGTTETAETARTAEMTEMRGVIDATKATKAKKQMERHR